MSFSTLSEFLNPKYKFKCLDTSCGYTLETNTKPEIPVQCPNAILAGHSKLHTYLVEVSLVCLPIGSRR